MHNRLRIYRRLTIRFIGAILCGWLSLILIYGLEVSRLDKTSVVKADAIIVLTGGQDRISSASDLMAKGFAEKLLLTGVGGGAEIDDIIRLAPSLFPFRTCCISLGRDAQNTRGNAVETAKWAQQMGYNSLIIVTSLMHLPRAMHEFRQILPQVQLQAYRAGPDLGEFFSSNKVLFLRTLSSESLKYFGAMLRTKVENLISMFSQGD